MHVCRQMIICRLHEVDFRDIDFAGHELGKQRVAKSDERSIFSHFVLEHFIERLSLLVKLIEG